MKPSLPANNTTWLSYIKDICALPSHGNGAVPENLEYLNQLSSGLMPLFYHSIPMVYLLDYTTGKYLTMSESATSVLGYDPKHFLQNGLEFTIDKYEPGHLNKFNTEIFPDRLSFLKSIPPSEHANYIFTYNLSLLNDKHEYLNLIQRNVFIRSDEKGKPLLSLGLVVNIDHFNQGKPVTQLIEKMNDRDAGIKPELVLKKSYYLNEEDKLFSKREKEVLLWMAEGLTSKEIGDKLFISEGTVIIHRKNMLEKSHCLNATSLIAFAIRNQII